MLHCDGAAKRRGDCSIGPLHARAAAGRITAVVGPNASGKTTLLNLLAGVFRPDQGRVMVGGCDLGALDAGSRASAVAMVPQRPSLDGGLTVERIVSLGRLRLGERADRVDAEIESCGLASVRGRCIGTLSVGQAQRVHVARALAQAAPGGALVLDEPTAPMDHHWAARTWDLLTAHARSGGTVVVAVHDLAVAAGRADDAWLLGGGELVRSGAVADVLDPAVLERVFGAAFEWATRADGSRWLVPSG